MIPIFSFCCFIQEMIQCADQIGVIIKSACIHLRQWKLNSTKEIRMIGADILNGLLQIFQKKRLLRKQKRNSIRKIR